MKKHSQTPRHNGQLALIRLSLPLAIVALLPLAQNISAVDLYWDNNGATAGFGTAGGTWAAPTTGNTTQGWSGNVSGTEVPANVTTTTSDSLYFGTETDGLASGTITISGNVEAKDLFFGKASGNLTLNGGNIIFATNGTTNIEADTSGGSATGTHTINSNLMKDGGSISFGRQNTSGENYIINGVISGTTTLDLRPVNLGAFVALNGLNTFTGNSVSHVTGQVNVNTLADTGVASSIGTGSLYTMGGGGGQQPVLWYTGAGATSTNRTFRSNSTAAARIIAQDGALNFTGSLTTNGGGPRNFAFSGAADSGTNEVSGVISDGSGSINVSLINFAPIGGVAEAGTWKLSGNNTYTGTTTVTGSSTLIIGHNNALGSTAGNTTVENNSKLQFDGSAGNLTVAENVTLGSGSGGIRNLSGDNTLTGQLTLSAGADLRSNGGTLTFSGGIVSAINSGISFNGKFLVDTAPISVGSGGLSWTSNGNNISNASELNVAGNDYGFLRMNFSGYLLLGIEDALDSDSRVEFGWTTQGSSRSTLDLNGFNQTVSHIRQNSNSFGLMGDIKITDTSGNATLTLNDTTGTQEYQGRLEGGLSLLKTGAYTQVLNNLSGTASSNTGNVTINGGTLEIQSGTDIGDTSVVILGDVAGATLSMNGTASTNETIGGLSGGGSTGGTVNIAANNMLTIANTVNQNFAGFVTGSGNITKSGTGVQILSGTNTNTGAFNVNSGILQFEKQVSLYNNNTASWTANNLTVASGATAAFNTGGTGEFTSSDIAIIQALGSATGGFQSGSSIGFDTSNAGGSFTYSNVIADTNGNANSVGITKLGTGTLILDGANTYTGTTAIASGTLQANVADGAGTGALGNGGNITFAGGTLQYTAASNSTDYSSRIANSTSSMIFDTNGQDVTLASNFDSTNTGGITKEGTGRLIVEADGTTSQAFAGDKIVNGGTLQMLNDDVFNLGYNNRGDFFINNGATLEFAVGNSGGLPGNARHIFQNTTTTFGSSGGGTVSLLSGTLIILQNAGGANQFVTTGGSKNTITGGTATMQNSQKVIFDVADGTDDIDLQVDTNFVSGSIEKSGAGTLSLTSTSNTLGSNSGTPNTILINAGTFELSGNGRIQSGNYDGNITNNGTFRHSSGFNQNLNGVISGTGSLEKNSSSVLTLAGDSTYTGTTTISSGTVLINGDNSSATGDVSVTGTASLGGSGTIGGNTNIAANHFAGSTTTAGAVAQQTFSGDLTYSGGASTVTWDLISNSTANPGTNYDQFVIGGDLSFSGTTNLSLNFNGDSGSGSTVDWDDTFWDADQSWIIYDVAGTLTGVPTLVTEGWLDASGDTFSASVGSFAVNTSGSDIVLTFTAVPEPSTYALMGVGLAAFGWVARRRRQKRDSVISE